MFTAEFETEPSSIHEGKGMSEFRFISSNCSLFFDGNGIFYSVTGCVSHINSHAYML